MALKGECLLPGDDTRVRYRMLLFFLFIFMEKAVFSILALEIFVSCEQVSWNFLTPQLIYQQFPVISAD